LSEPSSSAIEALIDGDLGSLLGGLGSSAIGKAVVSLDSRAATARRVISLPLADSRPSPPLRHSLTLRNHGETVFLVDDPLDVPDEVSGTTANCRGSIRTCR
jgi:hypothetical protein